jgi:hypothetical protein
MARCINRLQVDMGIEHFSGARDFLYLSAFFAGLALGCAAGVYGPKAVPGRRNSLVTLGFCFLSAAAAALAAALVYAGKSPEVLKPLVLPCCGIAVLAALAFRFPRAIAFPLTLLGGLLILWLGYSFLRLPPLPRAGASLATVCREGDRAYTVDMAGRGKIRLEDQGLPLEFAAVSVGYGGLFPLVGGTFRGGLSSIRRGTGGLAEDPVLGNPLLLKYYALFPPVPGLWGPGFRSYQTRLMPDTIRPGLEKTLFLAGPSGSSGLEFH